MSTTEPLDEPIETLAEPWDDLEATSLGGQGPRVSTAIVPKGSIAGRSLAAVVAIMTFLAGLTAGAVMMVVSSANDWRSDVGREVTIQIRPVAGRDIEADVRKAVEIARASQGIADVRAYTKEESARLVQPWLGNGLNLDDLPIPRMIVVKLWSGAPPDFTAMRATLAAQVPSAILDDHHRWIDRMRDMAGAAAAGGFGILALVLAVTVLSVTFATRGAMATNRPIVEVLHYVGATDGFVASQFQRHFLILGFKGGAIGGGAAIVLFGVLQAMNAWLSGTPGGDEFAALFGSFSIGAAGYAAILAQIVLMALVTALASRRTVNRTLATVD
ncbi:MAG TPA: ABC transporter permease [Xanthobacteraceae bacterium]|nr:ABC transporter permease [Xanthobacteraceae bacterium]